MGRVSATVLLTLLAAPFLGSFFALLADRLPRGEPVLFARSRCRDCESTLGAVDLVPILSWLARRGRCRRCGAPIPRETLAFELGALLLALWAVSVFGTGWQVPASLLLGLMLATLAAIDARHMWLPDILTLPLLLAGLGMSLILPAADPFAHVLGAIVGYVLFAGIAAFYRRLRGREGLGLGDAKLFAAGGAWLGWQALPFVLLASSLAALLLVLIQRLEGHVLRADDALPFGPFLAFGIWLVWLYGAQIIP